MLSGEDRSVIEALHHAWLAAEVEGNGDSALLQLCTTTPVWLPPNQAPVCGRTAILQWLELKRLWLCEGFTSTISRSQESARLPPNSRPSAQQSRAQRMAVHA